MVDSESLEGLLAARNFPVVLFGVQLFVNPFATLEIILAFNCS
jgi:hypothetical protein